VPTATLSLEAKCKLKYQNVLVLFCFFGSIVNGYTNAEDCESMNAGIQLNPESAIRDRRGNARFPLREEVQYRVLHQKTVHVTGSGETLNIGSGGVLFTTQDRLPIGKMVELSVNWPARLGGTCPLKFVALGRVVRSEADRAAVRIERYEFKTRGVAAKATAN
jgi:hypothetical protein